ncbi:putative RND superfamily exporter protein [Pseudomonas citronellolis]|uniref:efflux RND transporter permease subunit n=1 Tax=Pseudomonas citronellolis TaxID=53408 RepID=UPI00209D5AEF|nr:MMPL family transporter [Pseudomonas citronellolis]MCP1645552.1 putative RND superfamily exporter protein [Pseudomonas citronellolis]MCP1667576.1 putative RND superfamily exporter protein [Pseudomonas citronellolis]MCP1699824.1 putative RND superfamily exporter protein [Pseudomonas citronellolis]MCP1705266.1 putative RND superfamily exporter protein [Pseudomonas citronellolis]MCP1800144.1 putative RND superfamily exporter protein [Pseudomonas citronellolis]
MNHVHSISADAVIADLNDFDRQSGTLAERLLFNNRLAIVLGCLLVSLVLGYQAFNLSLNAAFEKMIPTGHPYIVNFLDNRQQMSGMGNTLRIAVEARQGDIFDAAYLDTVRKLSDEIFLLPGVDRPYMKSLWAPAVRWTGVTEEGLDGGPVIPDDYDGSARSLEQVRINVERSGEIGQLVAANYRSSIILIPLQDRIAETGQRIDYHALSQRIEQLRAKYQSDHIAIHVTGFAKVVGDLIDGLRQVLVFFAVAIVICTLVLFWYTRCLRSTLLVVFCSLIAVVWLLGLLPTLGYELDPYSVLVPFLVFAIGMSHGAQKMNGIMQDIGRGTHRLVAARYTFRRLFLAGLTALLADAVGFAVLMVIDIQVIRDLAITASIGVAVLIFTNLVLLPILLSFTGVSAVAAQRSLRAELLECTDAKHKRHPFWAFLDRFTRRPWATAAVLSGVGLAVVGLAVSSHLKIGDTDPGAPELRPDSRYNRDNAFMVANYAASSDVFIVMVKTPQYACAHYRTLMAVDALERQLQQLPGVEATSSLAGLAKIDNAGMNEGSLKWYDMPRSQDMLNAIITRAPREMFNQNCDLLTIYAYLKDHKADTLTSVVDTVEAFAARHDSPDIRFLNAAGNAGIEAATNIVVKKANVQMLMLVYLAVIALAFIAFRSWRAVLCAVLPLMLTSILCEALMVWLNIGVKVATLPVIALGVGIGVDYALYVMTVTLARLKDGMTLSEAYYRALIFTGKVVVLTGITLGIAVATWFWSPIKFQADMGILLAFMFIWNMLGALILLPALAYFLLHPRQSEHGN